MVRVVTRRGRLLRTAAPRRPSDDATHSIADEREDGREHEEAEAIDPPVPSSP